MNKNEQLRRLPAVFNNSHGSLPDVFKNPVGTLPEIFKNPVGTLPEIFKKPFPDSLPNPLNSLRE